MQDWKKIIFIRAIEVRMANGEGTAKEIIESYGKLSNDEKNELKAVFKI